MPLLAKNNHQALLFGFVLEQDISAIALEHNYVQKPSHIPTLACEDTTASAIKVEPKLIGL